MFKKEHYIQNVKRARKLGLTFQTRTGTDKVENLPRAMDAPELTEAGLESTIWLWEDIDRSDLFIPIKPPPAKEEIIIRDLPGESEINALCWVGIMFSLLAYVILEMPW